MISDLNGRGNDQLTENFLFASIRRSIRACLDVLMDMKSRWMFEPGLVWHRLEIGRKTCRKFSQIPVHVSFSGHDSWMFNNDWRRLRTKTIEWKGYPSTIISSYSRLWDSDTNVLLSDCDLVASSLSCIELWGEKWLWRTLEKKCIDQKR